MLKYASLALALVVVVASADLAQARCRRHHRCCACCGEMGCPSGGCATPMAASDEAPAPTAQPQVAKVQPDEAGAPPAAGPVTTTEAQPSDGQTVSSDQYTGRSTRRAARLARRQ